MDAADVKSKKSKPPAAGQTPKTVHRSPVLQDDTVSAVLHGAMLQPKLRIGEPGDPLEREADDVAEKVVSQPPETVTPQTHLKPQIPPDIVQRVCERCEDELRRQPEEEHEDEEELVQAAALPGRLVSVDGALSTAIRALRQGGRELPERDYFESRMGHDFSDTRIHTDNRSNELASRIGARAFTLGRNVVFGAGQFAPHSTEGRKLIAHELTHVVQQTRPRKVLAPESALNMALLNVPAPRAFTPYATTPLPGKAGVEDKSSPVPGLVDAISHADAPVGMQTVQRDPTDDAPELQLEEEHMPEDSGIPDEEAVTEGIQWPRAQRLNIDWWQRLVLNTVLPIRDYDPVHQPHTWANKTHRAQQILREAGVARIERRRLEIDGVLGPRTLLALRQVAQNDEHPARAPLQTLGFNLDVIAAARGAELAALASTRRPEFLLEWDFSTLGERAIRYYDMNFTMVVRDRRIIDDLLFGGEVPEGIRREDRIALLRRMYGQEGRTLNGRVAFMRARREFLHPRLDVDRVIARDRDAPIGSALFRFMATTGERAQYVMQLFEQNSAFADALAAADEETQAAAEEAAALMLPQAEGAPPREETAGFIFLVYLPALAEEQRAAIVRTYLTEKAERERAEEEARQAHNREAAGQRADAIVRIMDDTETNHLLRQANLESLLRRELPDKRHFDLVIDDLVARSPNQYERLFDVLADMRSEIGQGTLVELSLAGRYANHPRVQGLITVINERRGERVEHQFFAGDDPHVILATGERLSIGQVAGDRNSIYYRDEDRERLKPASERRLSAEMERQARIYFANLDAGREEVRDTEQIGLELLQRSWTALGMSEDSDIEDIEVRESFKLRGVRQAPDQGDGIQRWEVEYEKVTRLISDTEDTGWVSDADSRAWQNDTRFSNDLFWLSFSQTADVAQTMAMVVAVAAVIVVAWQAGAIAALVRAAGGAVQVLAAIAISEAIYLLTHERWTLRGILVAGIEGYLGALGFRLFAPVGAAVAGRLSAETFRQLVVRWLVRHGTTGALSGVVTGPAGVFADDLIRIAQAGGGRFSGLDRYLMSAAIGLVVGAVAEIGGSALLAPIFRTADTTALNSLDEVVGRATGAGVTPTQWTAELTGALSGMRRWAGGVMDDAIADGFMTTLTRRITAAMAHYRTGFRITILRQIVEFADQPLTRQSVEGLELLLRSTRGVLDNDAMLALLRHVGRNRTRVPAWLSFIGGLDDEVTRTLATGGQLRALADAPEALALAGRRTSPEVVGLLGTRFANAVDDLETFAVRLNQLDDAVADQVLTLLRTRGAGVTPDTLLRIAHMGIPLDGDEVSGLVRLLTTAPDADAMERLLLAMPNNRVRDFLVTGHGANPATLNRLHSLAANPQQGQRLLTFVDDVAEAVRVLDTVDAAMLGDLHTFLQNYGGWRRNAERGLMRLLMESPGSPEAVRVARLAMGQHDLPGIESWTVLAGRQARNRAQLLDLELSLRDAIGRRAADPTTAIEVDFYAGVRRTHADIQTMRAAGGFNPNQHVNMDVVTTTQIREFKRANAAITTNRQLSRRFGNGSRDFVTLGRDRQALGGTHEHVLFIDFNTQLDNAFRGNAVLEARVLAYAAANRDFRRTVDRVVMRYRDVAGMVQTHPVNIPL